jgi:hypothetical protein
MFCVLICLFVYLLCFGCDFAFGLGGSLNLFNGLFGLVWLFSGVFVFCFWNVEKRLRKGGNGV